MMITNPNPIARKMRINLMLKRVRYIARTKCDIVGNPTTLLFTPSGVPLRERKRVAIHLCEELMLLPNTTIRQPKRNSKCYLCCRY